MMDVKKFLEQSFSIGDEVVVTGWLSKWGSDSVLFSKDLLDDLALVPRINLESQDIAFAILTQVELVGGGHCMLFHPVRLKIKLLNNSPLKMEILEVSIKNERFKESGYTTASLSKEMIDKGKTIAPEFFTAKKFSGDWLNP
jgi:hypothetical protein